MNLKVYRGEFPPRDTDLMWIKGKEIFLFDFTTGQWKDVNESTVVDTQLDPTSNHPIANSGVASPISTLQSDMLLAQQAIQDTQQMIENIDYEEDLSESSENPIQNKAVYDQCMDIEDTADILESIGMTAYNKEPFTIKFLEDGTFGGFRVSNLSFSKNGGTWNNLSTYGSFTVKAGDTIALKSRIDRTSSIGELFYNNSISSGPKFEVYGRISSLIKNNWDENSEDVFTYQYTSSMFKSLLTSTPVVHAENLILMKYLCESCYEMMFYGCSLLEDAPELKGTEKDPSISSSYTIQRCYMAMFSGCSTLKETVEPKLKTLANRCYQSMYANCTSLKEANFNLPTKTLSNSDCYNNMFYGCTSLVKAPKIFATAVTGSRALENMFNGCTNLAEITCLIKTNTFNSSYTQNWLNGVAASGTMYKNPDLETTNIPRDANGVPSGWTIVNV